METNASLDSEVVTSLEHRLEAARTNQKADAKKKRMEQFLGTDGGGATKPKGRGKGKGKKSKKKASGSDESENPLDSEEDLSSFELPEPSSGSETLELGAERKRKSALKTGGNKNPPAGASRVKFVDDKELGDETSKKRKPNSREKELSKETKDFEKTRRKPKINKDEIEQSESDCEPKPKMTKTEKDSKKKKKSERTPETNKDKEIGLIESDCEPKLKTTKDIKKTKEVEKKGGKPKIKEDEEMEESGSDCERKPETTKNIKKEKDVEKKAEATRKRKQEKKTKPEDVRKSMKHQVWRKGLQQEVHRGDWRKRRLGNSTNCSLTILPYLTSIHFNVTVPCRCHKIQILQKHVFNEWSPRFKDVQLGKTFQADGASASASKQAGYDHSLTCV